MLVCPVRTKAHLPACVSISVSLSLSLSLPFSLSEALCDVCSVSPGACILSKFHRPLGCLCMPSGCASGKWQNQGHCTLSHAASMPTPDYTATSGQAVPAVLRGPTSMQSFSCLIKWSRTG